MLIKITSCLSLLDNILLNNTEYKLVKKVTYNFKILHRSDNPSSWAKFSIHFAQAIADIASASGRQCQQICDFFIKYKVKIGKNDGRSP